MSPADQSSNSFLRLEEYFEAEDDRFVRTLRGIHEAKRLAGFVDRWKKDHRPWARRQIFAYLDEPFDAIGHEVVVKRLLKHAEADLDHELMARFLTSFDRLVRQVRKRRWRYDSQTRESWQEESLRTLSNALPRSLTRKSVDPWTGRTTEVPVHIRPNQRLFSIHTRYYLRRRAWRYFRILASTDAGKYVAAITPALSSYTDDDVSPGEHLLDCWGLMHACFGTNESLDFQRSRIRLRDGRSLSELKAAPRFENLWQDESSLESLLQLVAEAQSRLIRIWAMELLTSLHAKRLELLAPDKILKLLEAEDADCQRFGAELLKGAKQLSTLTLGVWLQLLETEDSSALQAVCDAMVEHVSHDRLTTEQCVDLACVKAAPVARIGYDFLNQKSGQQLEADGLLERLADAKCFAISGELAEWALERIGSSEQYVRLGVLRFFDSLQRPVRDAAWNWLSSDSSPGANDPELWCCLLESPYDDVRMRLVDELERREKLPGAAAERMEPVWCSVLLGVHRGGRQKLKATRQIASAVIQDPSQAEKLLPVLTVAVRSVRGPEKRAGLASVVQLVEARPELADDVAARLPELNLHAEGGIA